MTKNLAGRRLKWSQRWSSKPGACASSQLDSWIRRRTSLYTSSFWRCWRGCACDDDDCTALLPQLSMSFSITIEANQPTTTINQHREPKPCHNPHRTRRRRREIQTAKGERETRERKGIVGKMEEKRQRHKEKKKREEERGADSVDEKHFWSVRVSSFF